jgi:hypothetical protein
MEVLATALFALALVHTFSAKYFEKLAHHHPRHSGLFHLLGEVEIVFGIWAIALFVGLVALIGKADALVYVDSRNYVEPLFVLAVMVVAASKPILNLCRAMAFMVARVLPLPGAAPIFLVSLMLLPILGSFITEPAAMTLAALVLKREIFDKPVSVRTKYIVIGTLFVNVSIGGAMTPFAAPPVLMVAGTWGWDLAFMLKNFGSHVGPIVAINALIATALCWKDLVKIKANQSEGSLGSPVGVVLLHLALLSGIVVFAHHPPVFLSLMLLFLGYATAYPQYQNRLLLKEALLVAFFLAGLVVLGGLQSWWLKPLLLSMSPKEVYLGATALTAITDNAALTYLASQVPGLSDEFKYFVVAGAISGGGLTVIANAPNPAGMSILRERFPDGAVSAGGLFLGALTPTLVTVALFLLY